MKFEKVAFEKQPVDKYPFWIGERDGKKYWTNTAAGHKSGMLTNEQLMVMSDEQLEKYKFKLEWYSEFCEIERRVREYEGLHRGHIMLMFRQGETIANA